MAIEIKYHHASYSETIDRIDLSNIHPTEQAYPTGRLLDGSEDHGYAEEWEEPAELPDGRTGKIVYLFDDEDIDNPNGNDWDGYTISAEDYPWDEDHIKCFVLDTSID